MTNPSKRLDLHVKLPSSIAKFFLHSVSRWVWYLVLLLDPEPLDTIELLYLSSLLFLAFDDYASLSKYGHHLKSRYRRDNRNSLRERV